MTGRLLLEPKNRWFVPLSFLLTPKVLTRVYHYPPPPYLLES